jgi:hypothetical protein
MAEVTSVETKWGPWNGRMLHRLKEGYDAAVRDGKDEFEIDGQPMLVSFSKYLIQFLEGEGLKPIPPQANDNA